MKQTSPPSIMNYLPFSVIFPNTILISRDMNAHIGKDEIFFFCLHNSPNKNGQHLAKFSLKKRLICLKIKFQKRKWKLWTYTYPNKSKAHLDYLFIIKKLINCTMDCEGYSYFKGLSSNHRIISVKIHLNLHRNKKQTGKPLIWQFLICQLWCMQSLFSNCKKQDWYPWGDIWKTYSKWWI